MVINGLDGRGERIRTSDPLVPNQVLYQAEPFVNAREPLKVYQKMERTLRWSVLRLATQMKPVQQLDLSGLHVLDGGMATELERRGFNLDGPLWSAHVLESSPEAIAAVHRDYLEAGAD